MALESIINKYRPRTFSEVIGNSAVVGALQRAIESTTRPHSFLLTGIGGTGKTSLARIVASHFDADVTEIDAATNNGVDAMRELVEMGNYASMTGKGTRMFIIDECHMLTKGAWNSVLKLLEEPPDHLFIALCTTEPAKVPDTIKTRCLHIVLKPVHPSEMEDLLAFVCEVEGWVPAEGVLSAVVQAATGQPRKGLSLLQLVHDLRDREEVLRCITLSEASDPMMDLLRELLSGKKAWDRIQPLLLKIDDDDWDNTFVGATRYIMGAMTNSKTEQGARNAWQLIEALTFPVSTFDRKAAFYAAIGKMVWGG